ncbi:glycosyltransferase [Paenibacillus sp. GP183]|uniref:glycosyltransferase family 2 protein n=1 Tax=Paenibacillus sp. GP183 TaxID=1882751 RepID=UPI0008951E5C|nr:glycosyltransferase [Paenibacillus sp. GP183]SEC11258.1 Glycosyl transferase family 2 [Paenibacillus sp. GP183]
MNTTQRVTVLMPVYNGGKFLSEAIESILNQTYREFEFLIINDGSTDNSEEIIKGYNDSRIIYVENEKNIGLIQTLNKGLGLINSDYIARMDADDISFPTRLEKQIKFMDQNKDIAVSGTSIQLFDERGWKKNYIVRKDPLQIKTQLLFYSALMHPTVILRRKIIVEGNFTYNEAHQSLEDFGLWQKISFEHKLSNIQEVLLKYRINESGITQVAEKDMDKRDIMQMRVYQQAFEYLNVSIDNKELKKYRLFIAGSAFNDKDNIAIIAKLLKSLKRSIENDGYDLGMFYKIMNGYFRKNCSNSGFNFQESSDIYKEFFTDLFKYSFTDKLKFAIRRYLFKY